MTDRKKPTAGFWITVALVAVLVGYPLSFGPACWVSSHLGHGADLVTTAYGPLRKNSPEPIGDLLDRYSGFAAAPHWSWRHLGGIPADEPGQLALGTVIFWARSL
jgi:hypothetical protein